MKHNKKISFLILIIILLNFLLPISNLFVSAQVASALSVNANNVVGAFSNRMLGQGLVNWEHSWEKPFPSQVPGLAQAMKEEKVGIIRYAGGLWSNSVGWDRSNQRTPYTKWNYPNDSNDYWFHYGKNEIDDLATFSKQVGADVMIQVNIYNDNPDMWADMVKYTNIEKGYGFKYWEIGNENESVWSNYLDINTFKTRLKSYIDKMMAVDPTIKIISSGAASAHQGMANYDDSVTAVSDYVAQIPTVTGNNGKKVSAVTYHWYQQSYGCTGSTISLGNTQIQDLQRYTWNLATNSWRNSYSRMWADVMPQRVKNEVLNNYSGIEQGITELNFDSCDNNGTNDPLNGNHLTALWYSDVLGRLAYNGVSFDTAYQGYGTQSYANIYPDNGDNPTRINVRPSYYAFLMYAKYFGNQMVQTSTYDNNVSIWASKDTNDPHKLKLMITNLSGNSVNVPVNLTGFNSASGKAYVMKSTNPTSLTSNSMLQNAGTNINGTVIDGMDVAGTFAKIVPQNLSVNGTTFNYNFQPYTTTAIVLDESVSGNPVVSITSPLNNKIFNAGENVTLTSNATSSSSTISKVEYYSGATKIGEALTSPYTFIWNSVVAGAYDITAKAIDNNTKSTISTKVTINVEKAGRTLDKKYYYTWNDTSVAGREAWTLIGNPSTTQSANVTIKIAGVLKGTYTIPAGGEITPSFANIINGPIEVNSDINVYSSQRVLYNGSFNEMSGIASSSLTNKYYFTWYDTSGPGKDAWILVGNPSATQSANVTIKIAGIAKGTYVIPAGGKITPYYSGMLNGPVEVSADINIYTTQRVLYNGSFNEYPGIPANSLTNKYYFTWNDTSVAGRDAWTLVGNPSATQSANVTIKIAGVTKGTYVIPAGGKITPYYSKLINGPVEVSSDINIYTTQRVLMNGSFNEFSGIKGNNLSYKYYYPWYDSSSSSKSTWILIGNSSAQSATVKIRIAGILKGTYTIPAGGIITPYFSSLINGPVEIVSDVNTLFTTQRVLYNNSFNEMEGI
ncbi:MAG: Ig-like domain-containing protein [bacterium]